MGSPALMMRKPSRRPKLRCASQQIRAADFRFGCFGQDRRLKRKPSKRLRRLAMRPAAMFTMTLFSWTKCSTSTDSQTGLRLVLSFRHEKADDREADEGDYYDAGALNLRREYTKNPKIAAIPKATNIVPSAIARRDGLVQTAQITSLSPTMTVRTAMAIERPPIVNQRPIPNIPPCTIAPRHIPDRCGYE